MSRADPGPSKKLAAECPNECHSPPMKWEFDPGVTLKQIPGTHRNCPNCGAVMTYSSKPADDES